MMRVTVELAAGHIEWDKKLLKRSLRAAGQEVAGTARKLIRSKVGGGATYRGSGGSAQYRGYKSGNYQASLPGQPPVSVTGTLARSIKVIPFRSGEGVAIRDAMFYALFLQAGASGGRPGRRNARKRGAKVGVSSGRILQPRPFLTVALMQLQGSISDKLRVAVDAGLLYRKGPAR